jgi:thymidylate synthase
MDAVKEILDREELSIPSKNTQPTFIREYPSLELTTNKSFYDITIDDFKVKGIDGIQKLSQKLEIAI